MRLAMSDLNDLIHTNAVIAFQQGEISERKRLVGILKSYLELTCEPNELGEVTDNPEWDRGFQAAIALIKGEQK